MGKAKPKVLFICGSMNQTTMMHKIAQNLDDYDCFFTPYYCDRKYRPIQRLGLLDFTIIGGQNRRNTENYLWKNRLRIDYAGTNQVYDLYLTCTDLIVQENLWGKNLILIQEGMTDPENFMYRVVRRVHRFGVPRWLASTSTTGLSDAYTKFCVASEGYRKHFANKGCTEEKLVVTGIPNFDNAVEYLENDFPHKHYVLVATTDTRENFKFDNRKAFIREALEIAQGRQLIFKLHPNENPERSTKEILDIAPNALVFHKGNTNHMIANCDVLVTQYSSVVYVGLSLGKEVHSYFDLNSLREMTPLQNGGTSARNIAGVCRQVVEERTS
jgi:CDP-Glycerol:Poly(glycerophosphate) glycerophosphotransferase